MSDIFQNPALAASFDVNKTLCTLADGGFTRARRLGRSVCGRSIMALEIGCMKNPAVIVGGTHGMEWASVLVALRLACETVSAVNGRAAVHSIDLRKALSEHGAVIIPLLNPDGYDIRREGRGVALKKTRLLSGFDDSVLELWQSNANGVDINHNFNAGFYKAMRQVADTGITGPSPTRYGGLFPFSQPESRTMRRLCELSHPRTLYSLHSQGQEIYWRYGDNIPDGSEYIAKLLAQLTGFTLCEPEKLASHAGLKDWFIKRYNRPGFTLELGYGQNPLPYEYFEAIWHSVERALFVAMII